VTISSKDEFSSNCGAIAVCCSTLRKARSSSPPADGGGTGNDLRWCRHHQSMNLYSVFCWRNFRYSPGGYDTEVVGRARTVGDTSGDENECCCVEAACGWNGGSILGETADASVPVLGTSISRNSWSNVSKLATAEVGEGANKVGVGWRAGCESGSTADVVGVGEGMALV